MTNIDDPIRVPIDSVEPNDWNPFEMSDLQREALTESIRNDGFDQPILVVKSGDNRYRIIDGQHRYEQMKEAGAKEISVVVKEWDENEQKVKTVQRNILRGVLNKTKFTKLIDDVRDTFSARDRDIADLMGFRTKSDMMRHVLEEKTQEELQDSVLITPSKNKDMESNVEKQFSAIENLTTVLKDLYARHKDVIKQDYVYFMMDGKIVLVCDLNERLREIIQDVVDEAVDTEASMREILIRRLQE